MGHFGAHLHDVLLPALEDLVAEVRPERAGAPATFEALGVVGRDVGDAGSRKAPRPLVWIQSAEGGGSGARLRRRGGTRLRRRRRSRLRGRWRRRCLRWRGRRRGRSRGGRRDPAGGASRRRRRDLGGSANRCGRRNLGRGLLTADRERLAAPRASRTDPAFGDSPRIDSILSSAMGTMYVHHSMGGERTSTGSVPPATAMCALSRLRSTA